MTASEAPIGTALRGRVVSSFGRRALVELDSGALVSCVSRGRRTGIVCGDNVRVMSTSAKEAVIEEVAPRACLLYRSDAKREKAIAANVNQVVVVVALVPPPNADFIDRCLVAAEHAQAKPLIVLNKIDLVDPGGRATHLAASYSQLGYPVVSISAQHCVHALLEALRGRLSVLIGASGVGKSTLVNRLIPRAQARVGEISAGSESGRHTTSRAQLYQIDATSAVIDSPGMHAFGLSHLDAADLAQAFVEFRAVTGQCRFSNCRHDGEPECAIEAAARDGRISRLRLESYRRILASLV